MQQVNLLGQAVERALGLDSPEVHRDTYEEENHDSKEAIVDSTCTLACKHLTCGYTSQRAVPLRGRLRCCGRFVCGILSLLGSYVLGDVGICLA